MAKRKNATCRDEQTVKLERGAATEIVHRICVKREVSDSETSLPHDLDYKREIVKKIESDQQECSENRSIVEDRGMDYYDEGQETRHAGVSAALTEVTADTGVSAALTEVTADTGVNAVLTEVTADTDDGEITEKEFDDCGKQKGRDDDTELNLKLLNEHILKELCEKTVKNVENDALYEGINDEMNEPEGEIIDDSIEEFPEDLDGEIIQMVLQYDYECPKCCRVYDESCKLVSHLSKCTNIKLRRGRKRHSEETMCTVCDKTFQFPSLLRTHMRTHTKARPFVCTTCGQSFAYHQILKVHERIHTGERPYVCDVCDKGFIDKQILKTHRLSHDNSRAFICDECGRGFNTLHGLKNHTLTHTSERPFQCLSCPLTFKSKATWKVHMRRHGQRERNLVCDVCGRKFADTTVLKQHKDTHYKEKSYQCGTCGKKFLRLYNCTVHERIHNGSKPYACTHCARSFTQLAGLKSHQRTHVDDDSHSHNSTQSSSVKIES